MLTGSDFRPFPSEIRGAHRYNRHMDSETIRQHVSRRAWTGSLIGGGLAAAAPAMAADARSGDFFNVRQFGAKGDGRTDDTRAIQKTIDAAAETGGAVFLPPSEYACSELHVRARVALIGVPAWDYHVGGGSVLKLADDKAPSLLNITGANGATLDGLSLIGGKLGKEIHGILLNKPDPGKQEDTFRIERCQVNGFTGDGVRLMHVWCFSIRQSMIAYCRGDGGRGKYSPSYGIVYKSLENCVIKDNVLHEGCLRELLVDQGGHGEGVIVKDNPGKLFKEE
jgi:Pectate lyase superfamily protein